VKIKNLILTILKIVKMFDSGDGGQCGADLLIGCCFLEAKELEVFGDDSACRVLLVAMEI